MMTAFRILLSIVVASSCAVLVSARAAHITAMECAQVHCDEIICGPGTTLKYTGKCCPECKPIDCSKVQCPPPTNCASMQRITHLPGVCCPIYTCGRPVESQVIEDKCKDVQCPQVYECKHNKRQVTYPGECCPVCEKVLREEAIEAEMKDCSKVQCPPPTNCASMQRVTHLPGVCCPIYTCGMPVESQVIEDKCKDVQCPQVYECKHNKRQVIYPGECCPVCEKVLREEAIEAVKPDCSFVKCFYPSCAYGFEPFTPPGQCCPTGCKKVKEEKCFNVLCILVVCEPGEIKVTPEGECCPKCVKETTDCAEVSCLTEPACEQGIPPITYPGECCPVCHVETEIEAAKSDCSFLKCLYPACAYGFEPFTPPGQCCPTGCKQVKENCLDVLCILVVCEPGEIKITPKNQCCPKCVKQPPLPIDCAAVTCLADPICEPGESLEDQQGKCCPVCVPSNPCATVNCQPGSTCKVYRPTGEAFCDPSCDINNGGCAADQICQLNQVLCKRAPCPPVVECLDAEEVCPLEPETGPCEAAITRFFHNAASGQCETFVYGGCQGNANNFESLEECQNACGTAAVEEAHCGLKCPVGYRCALDGNAGEPYCTPL